MAKLRVRLGLTLMILSLAAYQNCASSGGSYPLEQSTTAASNATQTQEGCFLNGTLVANGTVQAAGYPTAQPTSTACPTAQSFTCANSVWIASTGATLSEIFSTCSSAATCTFDGITMASGGPPQLAYSTTTVPAGSSCALYSSTMTCNAGVLTSSAGNAAKYIYTSCAVAAATTTWVYAPFNATISQLFLSDQISDCPSAAGTACTSVGRYCLIPGTSGGFYHCQ